MTFLALILALLAEQALPQNQRKWLYHYFLRFAHYLEAKTKTGTEADGQLAWWVAVLPITLIVWFLDESFNAFFRFGFNFGLLYLVLGFRHFSVPFARMSQTLQEGDLIAARMHLRDLTGMDTHGLTATDVARLGIEQGILDSYRYVFGVLWFFMFFGVAGAVFFRLASMLIHTWSMLEAVEKNSAKLMVEPAYGLFAKRALKVIDYVPVRLTALVFACVGQFADALYCLQTQIQLWRATCAEVLFAATAGSIEIKLARQPEQILAVGSPNYLGLGDLPNAQYLPLAIAMVWRAVLLILFILLLIYILF